MPYLNLFSLITSLGGTFLLIKYIYQSGVWMERYKDYPPILSIHKKSVLIYSCMIAFVFLPSLVFSSYHVIKYLLGL